MNMDPVAASRYAGAVVPYSQPGPLAVWHAGPQAVDVYEPAEEIGFRPADASETADLRKALHDVLDYYADHQLWGWPVLFTKSSVAERFRNIIRSVITEDVYFQPEKVFDLLDVHPTRHVKSTKHHWQNLMVDRNKDETQHQRESQMELEVLRIWAKCVDEITNDETDSPNAWALCNYTSYLIRNARSVLKHSNGKWAVTAGKRFESLEASYKNTIANNELAYREFLNVFGDQL